MLTPVYTIEVSTMSTWEPWHLVGCYPSHKAVMKAVKEWHADKDNSQWWDCVQVKEWRGQECEVIHEYDNGVEYKPRKATR